MHRAADSTLTSPTQTTNETHEQLGQDEVTRPYAVQSDLDRLLECMRPLCANQVEIETIDGTIAPGARHLDMRMGNQSFFVPFKSLVAARKKGWQGWEILAGGVMERLRDQHSITPERIFEIGEVYEQSVRTFARLAQEGLTPKEIDELQVQILERTSGLKDRAARAKASENVYFEFFAKALKAGIANG